MSAAIVGFDIIVVVVVAVTVVTFECSGLLRRLFFFFFFQADFMMFPGNVPWGLQRNFQGHPGLPGYLAFIVF